MRNGHEQKREDAQEQAGDQREERTEKCEARAGADVGELQMRSACVPQAAIVRASAQSAQQQIPPLHRSLPSTNGTSRTFSCWMGPCPK